MPKTYTVRQVAEILGFSTNSIYTFLREKKINGVRIGNGRFRIPEEELLRILHMSKKPIPANLQATVSQTVGGHSMYVQKEQSHDRKTIRMLFPHTIHVRVYELFIIAAAVIHACTFFLISRPINIVVERGYWVVMIAVAAGMAIAALGCLLVNYLSNERLLIRSVLQLTIALGFGIYASFMDAARCIGGAAFYGIISASIVMHVLFRLSDIASFALLSVLFSLATPYMLIMFPQSRWLPFVELFPPVAKVAVGIGLGSGFILFYTVILRLSRTHRLLAWILSGIASAIFIGISLWFGQMLLWDRALTVFLIGIMVLFLPAASMHEQITRIARTVLYVAYLSFVLLFVIGVMGLSIVQRNIVDYSKITLEQHAQAGAHLVGTIVETQIQSLESMSSNVSTLTAFSDKNFQLLQDLARSVYEGTQAVRRILILDAAGDYLVQYPLSDNLIQTNFAFRDYFQEAVKTKKTFISDAFTTQTATKDIAVVISIPVMSSAGEILGVIVGSIDIPLLEDAASSLLVEKYSEQVALMDEAGLWLFHPQSENVFTVAPAAYREHITSIQQHGPRQWLEGERIYIQAAHTIEVSGWVFVVQMPLIDMLYTSLGSKLLLLLSVVTTWIIVAVASVVILSIQLKNKQSTSEIEQNASP